MRALQRIAVPLFLPRQARSTTVLCVRSKDKVCMIADGQVTMGTVRAKGTGLKVRKITTGAAMRMRIARTMKVYGRLSASLTIHMAS